MMNRDSSCSMKIRSVLLAIAIVLSLIYPLLLLHAGYLMKSLEKARLQHQVNTRTSWTRASAKNNKLGVASAIYRGSNKHEDIQTTNKTLGIPTMTLDGANNREGVVTSNNDTEKPLFILHVGPEKTGTTTIQWFASEHEQELEKDNIYYLGHGKKKVANLHQLYNFCVSAETRDKDACNEQWKRFKRRINSHRNKNHTVLVSEELFSGIGDYDLKQHLWRRLLPLKNKWRVRVIFTHRRFHEWLLSRYFQRYDPNPPFEQIPEARAALKQVWPGKRGGGGKRIISFSNFLTRITNNLHVNHPLWVKQKWDANFDDVCVFNMHETNSSMQESFYCNMVPEATHLCNHLKTQHANDTTKINPSHSKNLHFDMIAVRALEKGLFKRALPRTAVSKAVETFSKRDLNYTTMMDFPLECPTQNQTDLLLNLSLSIEEEMVPEFYASTRGEGDLRSSFVQAMEDNKFCSVDVNSILSNERWKQFFKTRMAF